MSTKNLARTVIEGGRSNHDKYNRRISLREFRNNNRRYCYAVKVGAIDFEEEFEPERVWNYRFRDEIHADKTSPCTGFLISRAGRVWDDVVSEIVKRFDTNTLPGRHIVYEHLVNRVERPESPRYLRIWFLDGGPKFWVDDKGILHHNPERRY
jgi:hypothetical protein